MSFIQNSIKAYLDVVEAQQKKNNEQKKQSVEALEKQIEKLEAELKKAKEEQKKRIEAQKDDLTEGKIKRKRTGEEDIEDEEEGDGFLDLFLRSSYM